MHKYQFYPEKVSIIIPVHNTETYIRRCVDSAINQTYKNIEIILIDDGSSDKSPEICDEYALLDDRIIVIHKDNGGLSSARNTGLKIASGEYISFLDSDDWMMGNMIEKMLLLCQQYKADISICGMFTDHDLGKENKFEEKVEIMTADQFMPKILCNTISSHCPNKIFHKELFKDIEFPLGYVAQDMMSLYKVFERADIVVLTNMRYYVYFVSRPDSTSNISSGKLRGALHRSIAFSMLYKYAAKHYPEISEIPLSQSVDFALGGYKLRLMYDQNKHDNEIEKIIDYLKNIRKQIMYSTKISIIRKIAAVALPILHPLITKILFRHSKGGESKSKY